MPATNATWTSVNSTRTSPNISNHPSIWWSKELLDLYLTAMKLACSSASKQWPPRRRWSSQTCRALLSPALHSLGSSTPHVNPRRNKDANLVSKLFNCYGSGNIFSRITHQCVTAEIRYNTFNSMKMVETSGSWKLEIQLGTCCSATCCTELNHNFSKFNFEAAFKMNRGN